MRAIINDQVIEEVKDRADILEIISRYTELKKSGNNYMGLCPFHDEKTPSFSVVPEKGFYHCFGCGESGDVISFLMKKENLSFIEAVTGLAEELHIPLRQESPEQRRRQQLRDRIYEMNRASALYYMQLLSRHKYGLDYLLSRGLDVDTIKRYGLGFAPAGGDQLLKHLSRLGYEPGEMFQANLVSYNEEQNRYYDRFRNRLMFPIIDSRSRVIGFGGRVLGDGQPKYLNTSDTPVFHKGSELYGLNILSKESNREKILLVEGYMDVISLFKSGINYSTACLGTSLTRNQARLIKRYGKEVYICYDGDEAGVRATDRAISVLFQEDIRPRIIQLKDHLDPDEFIKKYGAFEFEALQKKAITGLEFRIEQTEKNFNLSSTESFVQFMEQVAKLLSAVQSPVEQEVYIDRVSSKYGMNKESLRLEIARQMNEPKVSLPKRPVSTSPNQQEEFDDKYIELLSYALESKDLYGLICGVDKGLNALDDRWYGIFKALGKIYDEDSCTREERLNKLAETLDQSDFLHSVDEVELNLPQAEQVISELIYVLTRQRLEKRSQSLLATIDQLDKKETLSMEEELRLKDSLEELSEISLRLRKTEKGGTRE